MSSPSNIGGKRTEPPSISEVLQSMRDGEESATTDLCSIAAELVRRICQRQLTTRGCHGIVDAEDLANDIWYDLDRRIRGGQLTWVCNQATFEAYVTRQAQQRATKATRKYRADQRHCIREGDRADGFQPLCEIANANSDDNRELCESVAYLMNHLAPDLRTTAKLHLAGYEIEQIAHQLVVSPRTIYRRFKRMRDSWSEIDP